MGVGVVVGVGAGAGAGAGAAAALSVGGRTSPRRRFRGVAGEAGMADAGSVVAEGLI